MHPALILSEHRVTCCEVLPLSSTWMAESWAEGRRKQESFWSCLPALPSEPSQRLCGAFGSRPILSPMCLTFHDISPSFFLGLSSWLRGHPELLLSFQGSIRGQCGPPSTVLHVELEVGSTFHALWPEPVVLSTALTVPWEICLSCWTGPSL